MHVQPGHPNPFIQYAITGVVIALVLFLRMRRMSQMRPLKLEQLWIVPAVYAVLVALLFTRGLPSPLGWAVCAVALAVGCALGWQRGRLMHIAVDPETHRLNQKASMAGLLFIVVLIALKMGAQVEGSALHFDLALVTQAFGMLALGTFTMMRVEMYLRGRRLLEEARAA
ncbi:DUF1453 domain-containing protein [Sphingomonas sp. KR3-1]|uniref:DUF1453 domain-containing protein n=1 Tax=Sphingomonas sp. KR3-1 TaxID=3156611 RepID=UPI0032B537E1